MKAPRRFQAPSRDAGVLAIPPLVEAPAFIENARQRLSEYRLEILGRSWGELASTARRTLLESARTYLAEAGEPIPVHYGEAAVNPLPILLAGHQPDLYHPGVWIKNFALNQLARSCGSIAVNLVIDNDNAKGVALKIPAWESSLLQEEAPPFLDPGKIERRNLPYDRWAAEIPFEERNVLDEALFASLPGRASAYHQAWGFTPMLSDYWRKVLGQVSRTRNLGERLSRARRHFERRWGCHNLEVPLSHVCRSEPFAWVACHLLAHLPRFYEIYNACVRDYRRTHGIRNRFHPVPDLARDGEWLEAPFWAWRAGSLRRSRLFVRSDATQMHLRLGDEPGPTLPLATAGNPGDAIEAWCKLERETGIKIRTRALTTTLYCRLFLANAFIHGIGGAKYDELTDEIIRRFHGVEPPGYLVLSATCVLPFTVYPARQHDSLEMSRKLRDLVCNPQRHLEEPVPHSAHETMARKLAWISSQPDNSQARRERFIALQSLTQELRSLVTGREQELRILLNRIQSEVSANAILQRRDHAFCLFPERQLADFYKAIIA